MAPLVSIVTVSLNAASTIDDALASVARQNVNFAVEHVCVDGGSADGTRAIIDHWTEQSDRISRVYEPDTGIYDAMNKGLRAARGEYVCFLNADDFLVSRQSLANALRGAAGRTQEGPDLIVGDVAMGNLGRRGVWRHRRVPRLLGRVRGTGLFPVHQGIFMKRRLLEEVGGFDASLRLASDVTLFYELERRFPLSIRILHEDLTFMRAGGAANANLRAMWRGSREIFGYLSRTQGRPRAAAMVLVKTLQSLAEVRYGTCPHGRWFA